MLLSNNFGLLSSLGGKCSEALFLFLYMWKHFHNITRKLLGGLVRLKANLHKYIQKSELTSAFEIVLLDLSHITVHRFKLQNKKGKKSNRISIIKRSI